MSYEPLDYYENDNDDGMEDMYREVSELLDETDDNIVVYTTPDGLNQYIMEFCMRITRDPKNIQEDIAYIIPYLDEIRDIVSQQSSLGSEAQIYCYMYLQVVYLYLSGKIDKRTLRDKLNKFSDKIKRNRSFYHRIGKDVAVLIATMGLAVGRGVVGHKMGGSIDNIIRSLKSISNILVEQNINVLSSLGNVGSDPMQFMTKFLQVSTFYRNIDENFYGVLRKIMVAVVDKLNLSNKDKYLEEIDDLLMHQRESSIFDYERVGSVDGLTSLEAPRIVEEPGMMQRIYSGVGCAMDRLGVRSIVSTDDSERVIKEINFNIKEALESYNNVQKWYDISIVLIVIYIAILLFRSLNMYLQDKKRLSRSREMVGSDRIEMLEYGRRRGRKYTNKRGR